MSDHRITESKLSSSGSRGAATHDWLRSACIGGLLLCATVACRNEPTQTTEPLQPGAAGAANLDQNDTTRGMGTTGSGTRTTGDRTQAAPMSGSGSGNPGASANEVQRTGGDDSSERTGSGGTSGRSGGGHGGTAGRSGSAGTRGH